MDPLATVEQLTHALKRPNLDRDEALLALQRASGAIRSHCGWSINREVVTDYVVPLKGYTPRFWLPTLHLVSIQSITELGVVVPSDYYAFTEAGKVIRGTWWSADYGAVVVDYTHGYADNDLRMDGVRDVCLSLAARRIGNPYQRASESTGSEAWSVASGSSGTQGLTDDEMRTLEPYVLERL